MLTNKTIAAAAIAGVLACGIVGCDTSVLAPKVDGQGAATVTVVPTEASSGATATLSLSGRSVKVSATGAVSVAPDRAGFTITVRSDGSTPAEAERAHVAPLASVLETLGDEGVDEENIQTTSVGIYPLYAIIDYDEAAPVEEPEVVGDEAAMSNGEESVEAAVDEAVEAADLPFGVSEPDFPDDTIAGYEMVTTIYVSDVDVDEVGELIEVCVEAGADGVSGPSYYVGDYDDVYASALTEAVRSARAKAEVLAEAAGASVGGVLALEEGYQDTSYRAKDGGANIEAMAMGDATYELAPGQVSIEAQVSVTYELK